MNTMSFLKKKNEGRGTVGVEQALSMMIDLLKAIIDKLEDYKVLQTSCHSEIKSLRENLASIPSVGPGVAFREEIDEIKSKIDELSSRQNSIEKAVEQLTSELAEIKSMQSSMMSEMEGIKSSPAHSPELEQLINELSSRQESLENSINNLMGEIKEIKEKITRLESIDKAASLLEEALHLLDLPTFLAQTTQKLDEISKRLERLEAQKAPAVPEETESEQTAEEIV